jgi:hypothetical protein
MAVLSRVTESIAAQSTHAASGAARKKRSGGSSWRDTISG